MPLIARTNRPPWGWLSWDEPRPIPRLVQFSAEPHPWNRLQRNGRWRRGSWWRRAIDPSRSRCTNALKRMRLDLEGLMMRPIS